VFICLCFCCNYAIKGEKILLEDGSNQGVFAFLKSLIRKKTHLNNGNNLAEEIHDLMDEGQAKGLITNEESDMVHGVLDLKEINAHAIMIPRTEISSAPQESTLGEIIKLVTECGHTRIPIYSKNIDQISGILHAKDLLRLLGKDPSSRIPTNILRKPYFVPENQSVNQILKDLKAQKTHLAIVTDEYGGTAGIITIEDILEVIVGDIMDEHDDEKPLLTAMENGTLLVDARLEVEKLEQHLNIKLPKGDFESVGGFLIHLMGRIPVVDEKIPFEHIEFTIKRADQRKINEILVQAKSPSDVSQGQNP